MQPARVIPREGVESLLHDGMEIHWMIVIPREVVESGYVQELIEVGPVDSDPERGD